MVSRTAQCLRQLSLGVDVWWSFHTSVLTLAWRYLTCLRSSSEGSCYWSEHWTSQPTISHGTPNLQCNKPQHFQRNRGFLSVQYRCISFVDAIGSFMLVPCVSYRSGFPRAWRFFARLRSIFAFAVASALIRCSIPRCFDSSDRRRKVIEMRRLPGEGTACLQVGPAAWPSTRSADPRGIVKASSPDQSPFAPEISVHAGKLRNDTEST